ncbi:MAG: PA2779 family protein [Desulfofustis sp.]|nr:PA2779 family protein [Desulfofustis sp.]
MSKPRPWILNVGLCWVVLIAFASLALIPVDSQAALIDSRFADGSELSSRADQIETVRQALQTEQVAQKLADYGLSQAEVQAKLATLSDAQLHQLASLSDDIVAGDGLGAVIAVLVIIALVILILKLSDRQIIVR